MVSPSRTDDVSLSCPYCGKPNSDPTLTCPSCEDGQGNRISLVSVYLKYKLLSFEPWGPDDVPVFSAYVLHLAENLPRLAGDFYEYLNRHGVLMSLPPTTLIMLARSKAFGLRVRVDRIRTMPEAIGAVNSNESTRRNLCQTESKSQVAVRKARAADDRKHKSDKPLSQIEKEVKERYQKVLKKHAAESPDADPSAAAPWG